MSRLEIAAIIIFAGLAITGCSNEPLATWHMINVNKGQIQGDANLITIGDKTVMIDAGYYTEAKSSVLPYFQKLGIRKVNHFFVSHPDRDHYEGLIALLEGDVKVDNLYLRIPPQRLCDGKIPRGCDLEEVKRLIAIANKHGVSMHRPSTGFSLKLPNDSNIEVLHAQENDLQKINATVNDLSLIMKWTINEVTVLFTGDLGFNVGTLWSNDGRIESDIMKMPHHGGTPVAPNSFFDRVNPDYVLVPSPKWVWCGDRGKRPRQWVDKKGIPIWVNGINGDVSVTFNKDKIVFLPEVVSGECKKEAFGSVEWVYPQA